jgi:SMC interacting uncharacterized protein involved in chromosome segregation
MTNNKQQTEINAVEYIGKVNQFAKENNTDKPKQQTAIEWLEEEMLKPNLSMKEILEQAKERHKQQIINAVDDQNNYDSCPSSIPTLGEQYYNETYK